MASPTWELLHNPAVVSISFLLLYPILFFIIILLVFYYYFNHFNLFTSPLLLLEKQDCVMGEQPVSDQGAPTGHPVPVVPHSHHQKTNKYVP